VGVKRGELEVRSRPLDAMLTGIAAAAIGGAIWYGVAVATHKQFVYLAVLVGALAGQGVLVGARRGGPIPAAMAFVFCAAGLLVAEYFVLRSITVSQYPDQSIPLWQGFGLARRVVFDQLKHDTMTALFFAVAAVVATAGAALPNRRPIV
jgi:hypothetical protein